MTIASPARFTVDEYEHMVLPETRRFELLDGVIVEMPPKSDADVHAVEILTERFVVHAERCGYRVLVQDPLMMARSMPEPDVVLATRASRGHRLTPQETLLVVEVSDTTLDKDTEKVKIFVRAGIGEAWLIDINARTIERHVPNEKPVTFTVSDRTIAPRAFPDVTIVIAELFLPDQ
jgi:Uma2 family endonuclease